MLGAPPGAVLADVFAAKGAANGFPRRRDAQNQPARTVLQTGETVAARVDHGRWVADCAGEDPYCRSGIACAPDTSASCCLACGRVYTISFPDAAEIGKAEAVLAVRTDDVRNWDPTVETADDLKVENLTRGLPLRG